MKFFWLAGFFFLSLAAVARADSFFVEKTATTNVAADDAMAFNELVKSEVTRSESLVSKKEDADFVLRSKVLKLGKSYVVFLEKAEKSGKVRFTNQMKAENVEEFDTIAARLVRSVIKEVSAGGDAHVDDVTESEARGKVQRQETSRYWIAGFGPFGLFNADAQGVAYGIKIGYIWDIESRASVRVFWDGVFSGNKASFNTFGIGGNYFLNENKNAPYVAGDFGYGIARDPGGSHAEGFALGGGPGLRLFRTSRLNVDIALRFGVLLKQFAGGGTPSTLGAHVSILF